ncbi:MAG: AMP-binding protein [Deltaproteobacteria bacterium]|nr:AMP-binding protein [Deltaproteobacteria bacterium]
MALGPAANAQNYPGKLALVYGDRRFTWNQWNARINQLAHGLRSLGLQRGDKVAMLLNNCNEVAEIPNAVTKVGMTVVPLNYRLTADEIQYIVDNSDSRAFIFGSEFLDRVVTVRSGLPKVAAGNFIVVGADKHRSDRSYDDFLADQPTTEPPQEEVTAESTPAMIYTSGTTGRPKGVARKGSVDPVLVMGIIQGFGFSTEEVHLVCAPLYHSAPLLGSALTVALGGTLVIMPRFDAEEFLRLVEREKVTSTMAVPTIMKRLVALPDSVRRRYDVSSMRSMVFGAAPCPMETKRAIADLFGNCLYEYYGSTDAGLSAILQPQEQFSKLGSCGKILAGHEIKIFDDDGNELGAGEVGDIYIHNSGVDTMQYYKDPDKTERAFRGRYMTVGDVGYLDAENYLYLVDRKIDMVISGGVNIYPAEIEAIIHEHAAVLDVAVIGVPNDDWGEELKAVVQLKPGHDATEDEIIAFVGLHLADYKKPRSVDFVEEVPRNPSGKLLKRELRKRYWEGRERRI